MCWLVGWLTRRPQTGLVNGSMSKALVCSTSSPQACAMSPLFILYSECCHCIFESSLIIEYADDSVILSLLQDHEMSHGPVLYNFIKWCEEQRNVAKTKDLI